MGTLLVLVGDSQKRGRRPPCVGPTGHLVCGAGSRYSSDTFVGEPRDQGEVDRDGTPGVDTDYRTVVTISYEVFLIFVCETKKKDYPKRFDTKPKSTQLLTLGFCI